MPDGAGERDEIGAATRPTATRPCLTWEGKAPSDTLAAELPAFPDISVVIPHLNQPAELAACLASLARQDFDMARAEIIVVDNGSVSLPEVAVASCPNVRLVAEPLPGPGPARNCGVALSRAPIIAFLDADCLASPSWLSGILARFRADPELSALGGAVQVFAADPRCPSAAEAFDLVFGFRQERQILQHDFAATANLAVRRRVFETVGRFGGIAISEDLDWGQRAAGLGHRTRYAPEILVHHSARRSMPDLQAQWDRHISHFYSMQPRHPLARLHWMLRAAVVAVSPLGNIPEILTTSKLSGPRARILACVGLVRIRLYRARRMIGMLIDPEARSASSRWNR